MPPHKKLNHNEDTANKSGEPTGTKTSHPNPFAPSHPKLSTKEQKQLDAIINLASRHRDFPGSMENHQRQAFVRLIEEAAKTFVFRFKQRDRYHTHGIHDRFRCLAKLCNDILEELELVYPELSFVLEPSTLLSGDLLSAVKMNESLKTILSDVFPVHILALVELRERAGREGDRYRHKGKGRPKNEEHVLLGRKISKIFEQFDIPRKSTRPPSADKYSLFLGIIRGIVGLVEKPPQNMDAILNGISKPRIDRTSEILAYFFTPDND